VAISDEHQPAGLALIVPAADIHFIGYSRIHSHSVQLLEIWGWTGGFDFYFWIEPGAVCDCEYMCIFMW
jgi:hypothetical protein